MTIRVYRRSGEHIEDGCARKWSDLPVEESWYGVEYALEDGRIQRL
jgi:hypothetical protein